MKKWWHDTLGQLNHGWEDEFFDTFVYLPPLRKEGTEEQLYFVREPVEIRIPRGVKELQAFIYRVEEDAIAKYIKRNVASPAPEGDSSK